MRIDEFLTYLFKIAKESELSEFEIYHSSSKSFSVKIFEQNIDQYKNSDTTGVSLRGIYSGKMGYAYGTKLSIESAHELLHSVIESAKVIENEDKVIIYSGDKEYKELNMFNELLESVDASEKITFAKEMEAYAKSLDSRVRAVNYCMFQSGSGSRSIINSKGVNLSTKENYAVAYVAVVVSEGEENKSDSAYTISRNFSDFHAKELAREAVEKAVKKLGGKSIPSGSYKAVLNNEVFTELLEAFTGIFSADAVDKGVSMLRDKIGEEIAVRTFTIVDDPHLENGYRSAAFDDEGVATKSKNLIENGVLKSYLHNLKTAEKFGVEPTGNGSKASYASPVSIAPFNFYLKPSNTTFSEVLTECMDGVLITELAGLHSGLNTISGDFSLSAEGYLIKDGVIGAPVTQITVAGNFFQLIKNIDVIGSDLKFGMSGVGAPSVLVNEISVAGE